MGCVPQAPGQFNRPVTGTAFCAHRLFLTTASTLRSAALVSIENSADKSGATLEAKLVLPLKIDLLYVLGGMSNKDRFAVALNPRETGQAPLLPLGVLLGLIYQFEKGGKLFLGPSALELFPLLRGKAVLEIFFYGEVNLPTGNDPVTGKVSGFPQTVGENRFPAQPRAPYPQLIVCIHTIPAFSLIEVRLRYSDTHRESL